LVSLWVYLFFIFFVFLIVSLIYYDFVELLREFAGYNSQ